MIHDTFFPQRSDQNFLNEHQKNQYYCPICGHTMIFVLDDKSKVCKWCGTRVDKPEKSVYDLNQIKYLKYKYKLFLKKKEGI